MYTFIKRVFVFILENNSLLLLRDGKYNTCIKANLMRIRRK